MAESGRRAPDWEWDEIVLACDLVVQNGWQQPSAEDPRVIEVSRLLQEMSIHPEGVRGDKFRNPNGVGRKIADLVTNRPGYPGKPTNGGRRDKEVIERFRVEPDVMHAMAESIRTSVSRGEPPDFPRDVGYEGESEMEGRYLLRWHAYRERNQALRRKKINSVLAAGGLLACEVCEFDFGQFYGDSRPGLHRVPSHRTAPCWWREGSQNQRAGAALLELPPHDPYQATMADSSRASRPHPPAGRSPRSRSMALKDITRQAVLAAVAEYDRISQPAFLSRYGFDPARLYLLVHDGKTYDSKAIVGAAHGFLPGERPLASTQFSGGEATVGRLLRRLGFTVQVGNELTADRLERMLTRLQVNRSDGLPALYQPITLLWAFGRARRGDPRLVSWQDTQREVRALLQQYGRTGQGDQVFYPVAALHRAGLWELDADPEQVPSAHGSSIPQRWFDDHQPNGGVVEPVYDLVRESPEALAAAVNALVKTYFTDADPMPLLTELGLFEPTDVSPLEAAFETRAAEYQRLCAKADIFWQDRDSRHTDKSSSVPIRSYDARRAVLLRSEGHCENPRCTGEIRDVTDSGSPILEVDHIHDLALGGDDNPSQMIALCPNCHQVKTRGSTREQLRGVLFAAAKQRHERLAKASKKGADGRD